jgi:hypothetical protein
MGHPGCYYNNRKYRLPLIALRPIRHGASKRHSTAEQWNEQLRLSYYLCP